MTPGQSPLAVVPRRCDSRAGRATSDTLVIEDGDRT